MCQPVIRLVCQWKLSPEVWTELLDIQKTLALAKMIWQLKNAYSKRLLESVRVALILTEKKGCYLHPRPRQSYHASINKCCIILKNGSILFVTDAPSSCQRLKVTVYMHVTFVMTRSIPAQSWEFINKESEEMCRFSYCSVEPQGFNEYSTSSIDIHPFHQSIMTPFRFNLEQSTRGMQ